MTSLISITIGLIISQTIATLHVYESNAYLLVKMQAIADAGYLIVPNSIILPELEKFGTAFYSGLFFTLTIGVGLSTLSFACACLWHSYFKKDRNSLIMFFLMWVFLLIFATIDGVTVCPIYILLVPPAVFFSTIKLKPNNLSKQNLFWPHLLPVSVLVLVFCFQADRISFLNIRDYLLLSNKPGQAVNEFYYKYTLYPAEMFKAPSQLLLKTLSLECEKEQTRSQLEPILIKYDYVPVSSKITHDLKIVEKDSNLELFNHNKHVMTIATQELINKSSEVLKEFSKKSDRFGFFRELTFISLTLGSPIFTYILADKIFISIFMLIFILNPKLSKLASFLSKLTIAIFIGLIMVWCMSFDLGPSPDISKALMSSLWQERLGALQYINKNKLDIAKFFIYRNMKTQRTIPERYWYVNLLGRSMETTTYSEITEFLNDSNQNVVCQAYYSLGNKGYSFAINDIVKEINQSKNWYVQLYAYKALKQLGWHQKESRVIK